MRPSRSTWIFLSRAAVTTTALGLLLGRMDLSRCGTAIQQSRGGWLLAALAWHSLGLVVSTVKWERLLESLGIETNRWALFKLYSIGFFASTFLPGMVGGDVLRWHLAGRHLQERSRVAASILVERVTGFMGLVLLCLFAILRDPERLARPPVLVLLATMLGALLAVVALILSRRLAALAARLTRRRRLLRVTVRPLFRVHRILRKFPRRPVGTALGYSLLFYAICAVTLFLVCRAFGVAVGVMEALSIQVLVSLLTTLPISLAGLGLAQAGDVYLFGLLGVDSARAFSISIVRQLINFAYRLLGGIFFVRWRGQTVLAATGAREPRGAP